MQVYSTLDTTDYRVVDTASFYIDNIEIVVRPGDNLSAIVSRINESTAPVKAYIDPITKGLALEGTNAHMIRLEDKYGGFRVLQDLGILGNISDPASPNWHPNARVSGGSVFDMVIRLRDALVRGDTEFVGGQGIGGIDLALGNIQNRLADIGSRQERVEITWKRLNEEIPNVAAGFAREASLNIADAATDLSMMEFAHRAALQTAAKVIPPTLLDFLR
jgi:flagellar hook-associated protein 3 FlgL